MTLKKAKITRLFLRLTFVITGFITPILLMLYKFDFKTSTTKTKITFIGVLVLLLIITLLWKFKKDLYEWINSWEYSLLKYFLIGFSRVYIFILIFIIVFLVKADVITEIEAMKTGVKSTLANIVDCLNIVAICQCIAYIIVYPFEQKYDYIVKRLIRKQERVEDYNEAINNKGA